MPVEEQLDLLQSALDEQRHRLVDCEKRFETETDPVSREFYAGFKLQLRRNVEQLEQLVSSPPHPSVLDLSILPLTPEEELSPGVYGGLTPRPGLVLADTYRLEKVLGQGGMGEVWLATHLLLNEPRTIKLILAYRAADPASRERFIQGEARHALRLVHPNIVRVHDLGQQQQTPYIVMEYVSSGPTGAGLKDNSGVMVERAARLAGAMSALMKAINGSLQPGEQEIYLEIVRAGQAQLGEAAYAGAFSAGEALTMDEALVFAKMHYRARFNF